MTAGPDTTRRWRVPPHARPALRHWDGEYVVHHALANDTHRLSGAAGRVLARLLAAGELDAARLAAECGLDADTLAAVLDALARLDLVTDRCG